MTIRIITRDFVSITTERAERGMEGRGAPRRRALAVSMARPS